MYNGYNEIKRFAIYFLRIKDKIIKFKINQGKVICSTLSIKYNKID